MGAKERSGLARLNSLQIAGLAVTTSTLAAVSVLFAVRLAMRRGKTPTPGIGGSDTVQPAVDKQMSAEMPRHFTEDLILPGLTETGQDVLRDDENMGRSPEGV